MFFLIEKKSFIKLKTNKMDKGNKITTCCFVYMQACALLQVGTYPHTGIPHMVGGALLYREKDVLLSPLRESCPLCGADHLSF